MIQNGQKCGIWLVVGNKNIFIIYTHKKEIIKMFYLFREAMFV